DEMIAKASLDVRAQLDPDADNAAFLARYPKAVIRKFDTSNPKMATELDALVAYLQMMGTLVDFTRYDARANQR
ncbi:hypothetical protein ABTK74_19745, partial [Acinetobacter baumannii]